MTENLKTIGKTLLVASFIGACGISANPALSQEQGYGYCGIPQCLSNGDANVFESFLGIGDAKLSWFDCRVQRECLAIEEDIKGLQLNERDCRPDRLDNLQKDIEKLDVKLLDVMQKVDPNVKSVKYSDMEKGLRRDLLLHFIRCYKDGLYKPDPNTCISNPCIETLAQVEKLDLNEANCTEGLDSLYPTSKTRFAFDFESKIVTNRLDALKEKCIASNLRPAATIYGRAVLQKDLTLGKQCEQLANDIQKQTSKQKINADGCALGLYDELTNQVKTLKVDFQKLDQVALPAPASEKNPPQIADELETKIDKHFLQCESENLFPPDTSKCLSEECNSVQTKIAAFKVDKEDCQNAPEKLDKQTHYGFEKALVEKWLGEYEQKCKDEDGLPYAKVGSRLVYKSEYMAVEDAIKEKIAAMGHHGEKVSGDKKIKLMPYGELIKKINTQELNRKNCSNRRNLMPLELNLRDYKSVWTNAQWEPSQQFQEASEKLDKFKAECIAKKWFR